MAAPLIEWDIMLGNAAFDRGKREYEEGRYDDAIASFVQSRGNWVELEALPMLVRVEHHLALAYIELGAEREALPIAVRVRRTARDLGDARTESMAVTSLYRLRVCFLAKTRWISSRRRAPSTSSSASCWATDPALLARGSSPAYSRWCSPMLTPMPSPFATWRSRSPPPACSPILRIGSPCACTTSISS